MTSGEQSVKEAKMAMRQLEKDILKLVKAFEDSYGVTIQDISNGVNDELTESGILSRTSSIRLYGGL
jgi:hypothetical protein